MLDPNVNESFILIVVLSSLPAAGSMEDLIDMAETVAATLAEAGASPQEIASAIKAALTGREIDDQLTKWIRLMTLVLM